MPGTKVKIRARLCPHKSLADKSADPTWPRPVGVRIELTKQGGTHAPKALKPTDADGEASDELGAGKYKATLAAGQPSWNGWECAADDLEVGPGEPKKTFNMRLVPPEDRRLLAVRLVHRADPDDDPKGFEGGTIHVTKGKDFAEDFGPSSAAGHIYAFAPPGNACVRFNKWTAKDGTVFEPVYEEMIFDVPGPSHKKVTVAEFGYRPAHEHVTPPVTPYESAQILIAPKVEMPSGSFVPLTGASVAVDLHPDSGEPGSLEGTLGAGEKHVSFENQPSGVFGGMVTPPGTFNGWPVRENPQPIGNHYLPAGESVTVAVAFTLDTTRIEGQVLGPQGAPLEQDLRLEISSPGMHPLLVTAYKGTFIADVPTGASLKVRLAPGATPKLDGVPLEMKPADQDVLPPPQVTTVTLAYQHYITGQTVDENRDPMPYAVVDVFDGPDKVASGVSDQDGLFLVGLKAGGSYIVSVQTEGGEPVTGKPVTISSGIDVGQLGPRLKRLMAALPAQDSDGTTVPRAGGSGAADAGGTGAGGSGGARVREAFTDLAAYPVLTEEVSTTGPPAPVAGGLGGGAAGTGYGQAVDQVIRDVLGWRPSGDVAGFQAALSGAFQLREMEGHTEWTWQQRGYAVQADMGALTGAQASIYARAKSALDQILPLLAGLTPLNPALFPPQDLEAIRTVITTELAELVGELGLEGGPRIQRVDELFGLLLGDKVGSKNLNPDVIHGQLGILRDRFGLTADEIDTVDEERIVTNFRIVVEQVLALQASWSTDRDLLTPLDPRASFGTILIWLSRSLEAVVDSVSDLNFALDSVFVDAAQRQVIELRFPGEPVLLLSDLLDWVVRATRDEGPRIIQDAGKDGVFAFAPVLRRLHGLVRSTRQAAHKEHGLPHGMRTPRVDRALQVLVAQLGEAADLAGQVRRDAAPSVAFTDSNLDEHGQLVIDLVGSNFRRNATAFLFVQDREDIPDVRARYVRVLSPSTAAATFRKPKDSLSGLTWSLVLTNEDGTSSQPVTITIPVTD
jgi:hypothetical protein